MTGLRVASLAGVAAVAFGCAEERWPPFELTAVVPAVVPATTDTEISLAGHFPVRLHDLSLDDDSGEVDDRFAVVLLGEQQVPLEPVTRVDSTEVRATVRAGLPPGMFDLEVTDPFGRRALLTSALGVAPAGAAVGASCDSHDDCLGPCSSLPLCLDGRCVVDLDADSDGFLDAACGGDDCDDAGPCGAGCYPGNPAEDLCDGMDQNCDGRTDEQGGILWFEDADLDGHTNNVDTLIACNDPDGALGHHWVAAASARHDCDDDPEACGARCFPNNPAADVCDGYDQDCDGEVDEDAGSLWYPDADGDGTTDNDAPVVACDDPDGAGSGWLANASAQTDCDDHPGGCGAECSPGLTESVADANCTDTWDNDCDGRIDAEQSPECAAVGPHHIYRSVGPGSTSALATGIGNPVTVSGWRASFDAGLPDHVGVGDVLVYDVGGGPFEVAFVTRRISATEMVVTDVAGGPPVQTVGDESWELYRAYTSLAAAENGDENPGIRSAAANFDTWTTGLDLVGNDWVWHIACYGDAVDTANARLDGWNTDAEHYLHVFAPYEPGQVGVSQRHDGTWRSGAYTLQASGSIALASSVANVRIEGLQFEGKGDFGLFWGALIRFIGGNVWFSHNIATAPTASGSDWGIVHVISGAMDVRMINNVIFATGVDSDCVYAGGGNWWVYNNTFHLCGDDGIDFRGASIVARNNISTASVGNGFVGSFGGASDYNLTDGGASTGGANDGIGVTLTYVDAAAGDLHLDVGDTAAIGACMDLSADADAPFADDIDGDPRPPGAWDCGADQL